jgi:chitinase
MSIHYLKDNCGKVPFLTIIVAVSLLLAACSKDDPETKPDPGIVDPPTPEVPATEVPGRAVVAYVTYYGSDIPNTTYLTHICYAFAELYVTGGVYKGFKIQGSEQRFQSIVDLKKNKPGLKILLSFTHIVSNSDNSQGGGFSALAKNSEYREKFAEDCLSFIKKWGIDGIDLDWEFPGISWSGHASDPAVDVQNHILLMKELRETLGSSYTLTYAGYVKDKQTTSTGSKYIDISAVDKYIDFVNIMTYDMDEAPKAHSALSDSRAYCDCERAVNAYTNAGISPQKLVLGVPFYGRHAFSGTSASISYKSIITLGGEYKIDNWDSIASVPYVTKNGTYFCSYDNAKSIGIKANWLNSKNMKGMMYWNSGEDDSNRTLAKAVWNSTMKK